MPLYEYECGACGNRVEVLQSLHASAPACGPCSKTMKKQISRSSFALKGEGWYRDHYGLKPATKTD